MTASSSSSRPLAAVGRSPFHGFTSEETLELLNEELGLLGIQTIARIPTTTKTSSGGRPRVADDGVDKDVEQLLQTLFQLVQLQRRNVVAINDLETDKRTSGGERDRLSRQLQQLQQQQAALKQSVFQAQEKERRAEVKGKELAKMLNAERDEKKKLFQAMQYKEKQFVHESRKNEREMARLKEHLQQVDRGDNILVPPKIEIVNELKRPGGRRRSTWSNLSSTSSLTKEEEALYSVVVANFGERQKQLLAENASLRQSLAQLGRKVDDVLGKDGFDKDVAADPEGDVEPGLLLPIQLLNLNDVERKLDRVRETKNDRETSDVRRQPKSHMHISEISEKRSFDTTATNNSEAEHERLVAKLEYYEETIERQAKMIERLAIGGNSSSSSSTASSSFISVASSASSASGRLQERTNLGMDEIQRERQTLMREKKEVADEALNLARERLRLREAHCRLVAPPDRRHVGIQSVQNTAAMNPKSSSNLFLDENPDSSGTSKPSAFTDQLLANYLTDSRAPVASTAARSQNPSTSAFRRVATEQITADEAASPLIATSVAAASAVPSLVAAVAAPSVTVAPAAPSSGRSTTMTSLTSISRLNSTLGSGDDMGAYV